VSVLKKKRPVNGTTALRAQATNAARQIGPLYQQTAQQAAPLARSAGNSVRQGAGAVAEWATPYVDTARSWAAPQIENSAHAITDSLAPMISDALITAAHKIDAPSRKPGSRRGLVIGGVLVTAAAGTAALMLRKQRQDMNGNGVSAAPMAGDGQQGGEDGPDADMNGHSRVV
jgi:hypothetical protein